MRTIFFLIILLAFSAPAFAQNSTVISHPAVRLEPGAQFSFEAYSIPNPYAPPVREDFEISILESGPGTVTFAYNTIDDNALSSGSIETLSSMDECENLDPWWEPMTISHDDRCELWTSKKVYQQLVTTGKSWLNVDTLARRDQSLRWELVEKSKFVSKLNGKTVLLNALHVRTTRNDDIYILDDPDNPLILLIQSHAFRWILREISTAK